MSFPNARGQNGEIGERGRHLGAGAAGNNRIHHVEGNATLFGHDLAANTTLPGDQSSVVAMRSLSALQPVMISNALAAWPTTMPTPFIVAQPFSLATWRSSVSGGK
jgi:hypothetical protein